MPRKTAGRLGQAFGLEPFNIVEIDHRFTPVRLSQRNLAFFPRNPWNASQRTYIGDLDFDFRPVPCRVLNRRAVHTNLYGCPPTLCSVGCRFILASLNDAARLEIRPNRRP